MLPYLGMPSQLVPHSIPLPHKACDVALEPPVPTLTVPLLGLAAVDPLLSVDLSKLYSLCSLSVLSILP